MPLGSQVSDLCFKNQNCIRNPKMGSIQSIGLRVSNCFFYWSVNFKMTAKLFEIGRSIDITMSWGCWKHAFGIPGVRPMFLEPKLHKKFKNGFKTISYRRYRMVVFSNYFFWHQKSSKKWHFWTLDGIFEIYQKALICLGVFRFEIGALQKKLG